MMKQTVTIKGPIAAGIVPGPEHFEVRSEPAPESAPPGGLLLQSLVISADPYLRGGMKAMDCAPMVGFVAGKVLESNHASWAVGDLFGGSLPFSNVNSVAGEAMDTTLLWKLTGLCTEENISQGVGVLGMPGSTAYGGLIDVLRPNHGETIWVSAGAGAVGGMVGMIAKSQYGCTVLGSAGGPAKCQLMTEEFGFDHGIDYRQAENAEALTALVKAAAPEGIDMYYENVAGMHFEAAMASLRKYGRVAVCGAISKYNDAERVPDAIHVSNMIYQQQRIEGFVCHPWLTGQKGNFLQDMSTWVKEGKVRVQETFFEGIESWPVAFNSLFVGGNQGKVVVRL